MSGWPEPSSWSATRIDAETLTRARAMGVRGIVVAGLASKERRDFVASERRQRAALHRLPPFAVLVLEGAVRRPLAGPVMDVARRARRTRGRDRDRPAGARLRRAGDVDLPRPPADLVRVRAGDLAGREGTWAGPLGPRRFAGGVHLEAGAVRFPDGRTLADPDRRPGALRLGRGQPAPARWRAAFRYPPRAMSAVLSTRQSIVPDPRHDRGSATALAARRARRRPHLPVGRSRGGQDPPGQGVRRRARASPRRSCRRASC